VQISICNQTLYQKAVVVTDDNNGGAVIFRGNIAGDQNGPVCVPLAIATSQAGFGDIHYSTDGGQFYGAQLLSDGDVINV